MVTATAAQASKRILFFNLPRELRDQIYDKMWPASPQLSRATLTNKPSPYIHITADYRTKDAGWLPDRRIPSCMLVSKALLNEALEQYFRNIDWRAKIPASYFTTHIFLSNFGLHTVALSEMEMELYSLSNGTRPVPWIRDMEYSTTVLQVYQGWPMTLPILHKFEKGHRETTGEQVLFIAFGVDLRRGKDIIRVDLSSLEHIGFRIDKLVVDVRCTSTKPTWRMNNLEQLVEAEVKRLGRAMIGQTVSSKSYSNGIKWKFELSEA
jgi:hypothetical protein